MANNSAIEWTDTTWNPLAGCTWASPGCDHCYAAVMARRLDAMAQADLAAGRDPGQKRKYMGITNKNSAGRIMFNGRVNLDPDALLEPFSWRKPRRVFVNSMSDLFHKSVSFDFVDRVFGVMAATPQHTYQVLTKRPERMAEYLNSYGRDTLVWIDAYSAALTDQLKRNKPAWPLPNVWLGTSVENQEQADKRIPWLLKAPAAVRFLSCEPLLGPVDLSHWLPDLDRPVDNIPDGDAPRGIYDPLTRERFPDPADIELHWAIVGGESGHGARPMHPVWARDLRDQCKDAGMSFFFKQWGEWAPRHDLQVNEPGIAGRQWYTFDPDTSVCHVGKKAAGRLLDGREYNEMPGGAE